MEPGILATLAACGTMLTRAADALRGALGDKRKRVAAPEINEALSMVATVQERLIAVRDEVFRLQRVDDARGEDRREAEKWEEQRARCREEVVRGTPVLVEPEREGVYFCVVCSEERRRLIPFVAHAAVRIPSAPAFKCSLCAVTIRK